MPRKVKLPARKVTYDRHIRVRINERQLRRLLKVMKRNGHTTSEAVRVGLELYEKESA